MVGIDRRRDPVWRLGLAAAGLSVGVALLGLVLVTGWHVRDTWPLAMVAVLLMMVAGLCGGIARRRHA
jgi:hypothetical protein